MNYVFEATVRYLFRRVPRRAREAQRVLTEAEGRPSDEAGDARNIYINASDGGVAAYHIDQVIIDGLADLKAATTVLPLDAMVADAPPFVGREPELRQIAEVLSGADDGASSSIVVVSGPPGVGKTALVREAATAAHAAGRFSHVLFVDLRGYADDPDDRVQPEAVLSKLLILLGIEDADIAPIRQSRLSNISSASMSLWQKESRSCCGSITQVIDRSSTRSGRPVRSIGSPLLRGKRSATYRSHKSSMST